MTATYRGYKIEVRPTKCAYMTIWIYRIFGLRGQQIAEDDGGFTAEDAVRSAKTAIDRM